MIAPDKDLDALRKEHKDLSDYASKIAVLSLTVLAFFAVSFSRACRKVNGEEVRTALCQIDKTRVGTDRPRNVSYVFELFPNDNQQCTPDCPRPASTPAPIPAATPTATTPSPQAALSPASRPSPLKSASPPPIVADASPSPESSAAPGEEPVAAPDQKDEEQKSKCQSYLEGKLEESAQKWFGVKAPIPGVDISVDMRYWIFGLPILFFLSGVYLHILDKKISMLRILISQRVEASGDDSTQLDRLMFGSGGRTSFARFPGSLGRFGFIAAYLFLPVYLLYVSAPLWKEFDLMAAIAGALLLLTMTFYAVAYAHFATHRLDRQLVSLTKQISTHNLIDSFLSRSKRIVNWLGTHIPLRLTLSTGSLLIILTLFLTMSQESCGEKRFTGLEIARGAPGAKWPTADALLGTNAAYNNIARAIYIACIVLALMSLLTIMVRKLRGLWFVKFLATSTITIFVFSVVDFSLAIPLLSNWFIPLKLSFWAVPVFLWFRYSWSKSRRERWPDIRSVLVVLFVPLFLFALLYVVPSFDLPGLSVFFGGLCLLTLGYLQVTLAWSDPKHEP